MPAVSRAYPGTTTLTAHVRVTDPHGFSSVAGAFVKVDSLRPVISALAVHRASITYRLSERARVTIRLQRRVRHHWRVVRTLRQKGVKGKNRLRTARAGALRKRRNVRVRYRTVAFAVDAVGNRSAKVRLRVSAAVASRLRRR